MFYGFNLFSLYLLNRTSQNLSFTLLCKKCGSKGRPILQLIPAPLLCIHIFTYFIHMSTANILAPKIYISPIPTFDLLI